MATDSQSSENLHAANTSGSSHADVPPPLDESDVSVEESANSSEAPNQPNQEEEIIQADDLIELEDDPPNPQETPSSEASAPGKDVADPSESNELANLLTEKDNAKARGAVVLGRYKILDILGRGAFSVVYRASQVGIGRIVALKVFRLHKSTRSNTNLAETALNRFQREARLASMLRHPHTITLFDFDKTSQGVVYMAFEFIDGPTLTDLIKDNPDGISPERVIRIARRIAQSLQEAHDTGIIHRDLKPGNIMLMKNPKDIDDVKVLDFGIAKMIEGSPADPDHIPDHSDELSMLDFDDEEFGDEHAASLTHEGRIVGTPRYIPPEQIHGHDLKGSADLYSLGLIMHEMLTGVPANPGKTPKELLKWHLSPNPLQAPDGFALNPGLDHIINKMTARPIAERYANCAALIDDLNRLDDDGNWVQEPPKKRNILPFVIGLNVLMLVALIISISSTFNEPETSPPDPPETSTTNAAVAPDTGVIDSPDTAQAEAIEVTPEPDTSPPPAPEKTTVQISTSPTGAAVLIEETVVGTTPIDVTLQPDQTELNFTLKKQGYQNIDISWNINDPSPFPVTLKRRQNKRPPSGTKPKYRIIP